MRLLGYKLGFTLLEVLIVLVILGIIAGLAIPAYNNTVEQSRANEAQVNLYTIYMAEKIYKVNSRSTLLPNGTYLAVLSTTDMNSINQPLNINLATPKYYPVIAIGAGTTGDIATSFRATASQN